MSEIKGPVGDKRSDLHRPGLGISPDAVKPVQPIHPVQDVVRRERANASINEVSRALMDAHRTCRELREQGEDMSLYSVVLKKNERGQVKTADVMKTAEMEELSDAVLVVLANEFSPVDTE